MSGCPQLRVTLKWRARAGIRVNGLLLYNVSESLLESVEVGGSGGLKQGFLFVHADVLSGSGAGTVRTTAAGCGPADLSAGYF